LTGMIVTPMMKMKQVTFYGFRKVISFDQNLKPQEHIYALVATLDHMVELVEPETVFFHRDDWEELKSYLPW
jgi:hypothetical protein